MDSSTIAIVITVITIVSFILEKIPLAMTAMIASLAMGILVPEMKLSDIYSGFSSNNVIMDGRDIGTVVLPGADLKIFLTASAEARAMRRCKELRESGLQVSLEDVLREIEERDEHDMSRATAPLKCARDAIKLDTSVLTLEESIDAVCVLIADKLGVVSR